MMISAQRSAAKDRAEGVGARRPSSARRLAFAAFALASLIAMPAFGQDLSPEMEQRRTRLFKEGRSLFDAGKYSDAAEKFRGVVELRSAPKALIALALAEEKSGHLAEAKRLYEKAREDAHGNAKLKNDEEAAAQSLRRLLPRVPRIGVSMPSGVSGASLMVDGKQVELEFGEVDVDPGEHTVTATASGYNDFSETVTLAESERKGVKVVLTPLQVTPPKPVEEEDKSLGPPPLGALLLAGVGFGAGITGVVLWGVGRSQEGDVEDMCGGIKECPASLKADADAASTKIIVGDVLVGVGGAAMIGGGIWWLASSRSAQSSGSEPPESSALRPRVLVTPLRGGAWATVEGRF